jgi:hypothetical protein
MLRVPLIVVPCVPVKEIQHMFSQPAAVAMRSVSLPPPAPPDQPSATNEYLDWLGSVTLTGLFQIIDSITRMHTYDVFLAGRGAIFLIGLLSPLRSDDKALHAGC